MATGEIFNIFLFGSSAHHDTIDKQKLNDKLDAGVDDRYSYLLEVNLNASIFTGTETGHSYFVGTWGTNSFLGIWCWAFHFHELDYSFPSFCTS